MNTNLMVERAALLVRSRARRPTMRDMHREVRWSLSKELGTVCVNELGFMVDGSLVFEGGDEA